MTLQKLGVTVIVKIYTAFSVFQTLFLSSLCGLSHLILTSVLWGGNNYELLHRWGNRGIVRFRNLPKATQLGSGSAGTPTPTLCARVSSQPLYNAACSHRAGGGGGASPGRRCRGEEGPMGGGFCCDIPSIFTEFTIFYGKYFNVRLEKNTDTYLWEFYLRKPNYKAKMKFHFILKKLLPA